MNIKAIVFDLDGTLVESTSVYLAAYMKVLERELDLKPESDQIEKKFGKRATRILVEILEEAGFDPQKTDVEHIINSIRDEFLKSLDDVKILPGVIDLLKEFKDEYKIALATSSRPYAVDPILEKFDLRGYFDVVITAEDVTNAKPDPEIFQLAAKKLSVKPEECLVFEDTVHGVESAKNAGAKVAAVATGYATKEDLKALSPDFVLGSLEEFDPTALN